MGYPSYLTPDIFTHPCCYQANHKQFKFKFKFKNFKVHYYFLMYESTPINVWFEIHGTKHVPQCICRRSYVPWKPCGQICHKHWHKKALFLQYNGSVQPTWRGVTVHLKGTEPRTSAWWANTVSKWLQDLLTEVWQSIWVSMVLRHI